MTVSAISERYGKALFSADWETLGALRHENFVARWPQSGEVVRGHDKWVEITQRYPQSGGDVGEVHGGEKPTVRRVQTPLPLGPPILAMGGPGNSFTLEGKIRYPDGTTYCVVSICKVEGGKVVSETSYFAEPFDPPEWRADLVELED